MMMAAIAIPELNAADRTKLYFDQKARYRGLMYIQPSHGMGSAGQT